MAKEKMLSSEEIGAFCSQLACIIRSGVPVREGVGILLEDAGDQRSKEILGGLSAHLEDGAPLDAALESVGCFPDYMIHMVQIGISAGRLDEVLEALCRYYEDRTVIRRSIRSAVAYPLVMIVMLGAVIGVLVVKVLPVFRQALEQIGSAGAGLSARVTAAGSVLAIIAAVVVGVVLIAALIIAILDSTPNGRASLDRFWSRFGPTRELSRKSAAARFASTMSLMLASGMGIPESLELSGTLMDLPDDREKLSEISRSTAAGASFGEEVAKAGLFSRMDSRLISIGFKTGSVDRVMEQLAGRYQDEVTDRIGELVAAIEPILVAVLSVVVGVMILSIMLPLLNIMSGIA